MTIKAQATLGALLGTVTTAATTVTTTFDTIHSGVKMANRYVNDQARKQAFNSTIDMGLYEKRTLLSKKQEYAEHMLEVRNWGKDNPERQELFEQASNEIDALFTK